MILYILYSYIIHNLWHNWQGITEVQEGLYM